MQKTAIKHMAVYVKDAVVIQLCDVLVQEINVLHLWWWLNDTRKGFAFIPSSNHFVFADDGGFAENFRRIISEAHASVVANSETVR